MKLIGIMPVRNEDWILGWSLRALLMWCDEVIALNHASTDRTFDIIKEIETEAPTRLIILTELQTTWYEMMHRQRLLDTARVRGATHIAMVDADEILTANLLPVIRAHVEETPIGSVLQVPWICTRGSIGTHYRSGPWSKQDVSLAFRDDLHVHWTAREGYDFHHRHPMGWPFRAHKPVKRSGGGLLHLQFVSERRLRAKQALYKMTEVTRWPGRESLRTVNTRYNMAVYGAELPSKRPLDLLPVPSSWLSDYEPLLTHYHPDAEPWQEREVKRLWSAHGAEKFAGLDLFGVVDMPTMVVHSEP